MCIRWLNCILWYLAKNSKRLLLLTKAKPKFQLVIIPKIAKYKFKLVQSHTNRLRIKLCCKNNNCASKMWMVNVQVRIKNEIWLTWLKIYLISPLSPSHIHKRCMRVCLYNNKGFYLLRPSMIFRHVIPVRMPLLRYEAHIQIRAYNFRFEWVACKILNRHKYRSSSSREWKW